MSLSLRDAWLVLGRHPKKVAEMVRSKSDRMVAIDELLISARSLARRLLGLHHPDKNPGDPGAVERFALVQEALSVVEAGTEDFKRQSEEGARVKDGAVFIEIDVK